MALLTMARNEHNKYYCLYGDKEVPNSKVVVINMLIFIILHNKN